MAFFEPKYAEWKCQFQPKSEVIIWRKLEKAISSTVSSKEGSGVEQENHSHKENLAVWGKKHWENDEMDSVPRIINFSTVKLGSE